MSSGYMPYGVMSKKVLGKTGIEVSRLSFGSHLKKSLIRNPKLRDRMIKMGFEYGITTFDVYDHGGYKQFIPMGKSLRDFRKDAVISLCIVKTTSGIQAEIDDTLTKFHTDYIDLYRLYSIDDDRINYMEKNKKAGKIRAIGIVSHDADELMQRVNRYQNILDYVMIIFNFHHNTGLPNDPNYHSNDYSALIPLCRQMGLGIIGIKPMGSDNMIKLATDKGFFNDEKTNIAQAMLRYVFQYDEIDSAIPAMNTMDEVKVNLEAVYNPAFSSYDKTVLEKLSRLAATTKRKYLESRYKWLDNWATWTV